MERVMGIEPTSSAWEAEVLPLNYTRPRNHRDDYRPALQPEQYPRPVRTVRALAWSLTCL